MDKQQLRKSVTQKLTAKSLEEKQLIELNITETLLHSKLWEQSQIIGITISRGVEWNTKLIIKEAWRQGKIICIPKSYPKEHKMIFYKIHTFKEVKNQYHDLLEPIPEISEQICNHTIDLLIVPGLLFDKYGFRIGFGGGYYDRFLADFPNETLSLLSKSQLVDKLPTESYDIPVNYLIVENEMIRKSPS